MKQRWRIPGKIMLAGEYSVLRPGGLALSLAVDSGIEVGWDPLEARGVLLERGDTGARWAGGRDEEVPGDLRFLHAGLSAAAPGARGFRLVSSPAPGVGTGDTKPGLGGSASAVVAGVAIGLRLRGVVPSQEVFVQAVIDAHFRAQGGRGSGYDVATVAVGGLTAYRVSQVVDHDGVPRVVGTATRRTPPRGWSFLAAYAGKSASTTRLVARLDALEPEARAQALDALGAPVPQLLAAVEGGQRSVILEATQACQQALRRFDERAQVGVMTAEVEALLRIAGQLGCPCKVSGAGGGDSVIALDSEGDRLQALGSAWRAAGFHVFAPPIARQGAWDRVFGGAAPEVPAPSQWLG